MRVVERRAVELETMGSSRIGVGGGWGDWGPRSPGSGGVGWGSRCPETGGPLLLSCTNMLMLFYVSDSFLIRTCLGIIYAVSFNIINKYKHISYHHHVCILYRSLFLSFQVLFLSPPPPPPCLSCLSDPVSLPLSQCIMGHAVPGCACAYYPPPPLSLSLALSLCG